MLVVRNTERIRALVKVSDAFVPLDAVVNAVSLSAAALDDVLAGTEILRCREPSPQRSALQKVLSEARAVQSNREYFKLTGVAHGRHDRASATGVTHVLNVFVTGASLFVFVMFAAHSWPAEWRVLVAVTSALLIVGCEGLLYYIRAQRGRSSCERAGPPH